MKKRKQLPRTTLMNLTGTESTGYRFTDKYSDDTVLVLQVIRPDVMLKYFRELFADRVQGEVFMLTAADLEQIRREHAAQIAA